MKSEAPSGIKTFATFRVAGDDLVPSEVTEILKVAPTRAYGKGETYVGKNTKRAVKYKTGIWLLSTDKIIESPSLLDHLRFLLQILVPLRLIPGLSPLTSKLRVALAEQNTQPIDQLRRLLRERSLHAVVTCFWHGSAGATPPKIPKDVLYTLRRLPADLERDFDTDRPRETKVA